MITTTDVQPVTANVTGAKSGLYDVTPPRTVRTNPGAINTAWAIHCQAQYSNRFDRTTATLRLDARVCKERMHVGSLFFLDMQIISHNIKLLGGRRL